MFLSTKMSEFVMLHPPQLGSVNSSILTLLKQMYIDSSCPGLGIGIKISDVSKGPSITDPNEGCCITKCTFLLSHIIPRAGDKLKKPTKKSFHMFSFDDTEEKVAVRFEGDDSFTYTVSVSLCQYLDPDNKLPIDPSIRFLCVAHPV